MTAGDWTVGKPDESRPFNDNGMEGLMITENRPALSYRFYQNCQLTCCVTFFRACGGDIRVLVPKILIKNIYIFPLFIVIAGKFRKHFARGNNNNTKWVTNEILIKSEKLSNMSSAVAFIYIEDNKDISQLISCNFSSKMRRLGGGGEWRVAGERGS